MGDVPAMPRIQTACSGTDSPVIALGIVAEAMERLGKPVRCLTLTQPPPDNSNI